MESYVNQVIEASQKLRKTKFDISEEWVGSLLLAGLPDKYSPMLMAIEHSGIAITTDSIKSKLLDMQTDGSGSSSSKAGAFAASSGSFKRQSRGGATRSGRKVNDVPRASVSIEKQDKSKVVCYRCRQIGHYMSKCPNKARNEAKSDDKYSFSAIFVNGEYLSTDFYLDSGASRHMSPNEAWMYDMKSSGIKEITVANRDKLPVKCSGNIDIISSVDGMHNNITVHDVLCVPNLTTNLLSVSELISRGNRVSFSKDGCCVYSRSNSLVATATLVGGVYKLDVKAEKCMLASCDDAELWHRRLAHINSQDLNKMKHCVSGLELKGVATIDKSNCVVCCEGKQARLPFPTTGSRRKGNRCSR